MLTLIASGSRVSLSFGAVQTEQLVGPVLGPEVVREGDALAANRGELLAAFGDELVVVGHGGAWRRRQQSEAGDFRGWLSSFERGRTEGALGCIARLSRGLKASAGCKLAAVGMRGEIRIP